MQTVNIIKIIMLVAAAGFIFWLWRGGHFLRVSKYLEETRDELRKCTWPGKDELKGSTVVVLISILLLGIFTVASDGLFTVVIHWIQKV